MISGSSLSASLKMSKTRHNLSSFLSSYELMYLLNKWLKMMKQEHE